MLSTKGSMLAVAVFFFVGVLQVCLGTGSKYGQSCNTDLDCMTSTTDTAECVDPFIACLEREFNYDSMKGYRICPLAINTTRNVPQPACVGVPEAVQNVQVNATRSNGNVTFTITWSPSPKYVGPVVYQVDVLGDNEKPRDPYYVISAQTDEDTFHIKFENHLGNLNYSVNITAVTAVGHSGPHPPVRITNTRPHLSSNEQLMSPYHDASTSFAMRLCSSCLVDPNLGLVEAIAIVVCDTRKSSKCQHSYVDPDNPPSNIRITEAEDMKLFSTWAMAKARNFEVPYRATPDNFHQMLKQDKSGEIRYTIGGNYCDESDTQNFCNGPVPMESEFVATVIICNDLGCVESHSSRGKFTTLSDDDDDDDDVIIGLAVVLGIAVLICILLAVYIVFSKRSAIV